MNEEMREKLNFEAAMQSFGATMIYGKAAMVSICLLAGGAALGLLVFSAVMGIGASVELALPEFLFFWAALCASGALALSYLGQARFTHSDEWLGRRFQAVAVLFVAFSYGLCVIAAAMALRVIAIW